MSFPMLLLNFAHPLTIAQQSRLSALLGATPEVREVAVQIDQGLPLAPQVIALVDSSGESPAE
ncbi:MAG: hypothetical protein HGA19_23525, partial [Oscillochloris sp.]|nr:hypothetical protein [Oscillochloris sp.]